jgi:hydrogenase nickel incorporation protein HypB
MCAVCGCQDTPAPEPASLLLELAQPLLQRNSAEARALRQRFAAAALPVINLLSAPGSGKTAVLEQLARHWPAPQRLGVVVADLATDNDARRLQAAGLQAVQVSTGQLCHLPAALLGPALDLFELDGLDLLVIENVGNLVCPALFDLGETLRVALLAVGEGEDKPLKYPGLFASADLVLINKIDLAAAVGFDRSLTDRHLRAVAPAAPVLEISAATGAGFADLVAALAAPRSLRRR